MEKLDAVMAHLKKVGRDFYGEVRIKVRAGRVVLITEERTFKLDDEQGELEIAEEKNQRP